MKRSVFKTIMKSAIVTLALLIILAASLSPICYYFGWETSAKVDTSIVSSENGLYTEDLTYHYFAYGKEYDGHAVIKNQTEYPLDPNVNIKYLPVISFISLPVENYEIPVLSYYGFAIGALILISGLLISTKKKTKKEVVDKKEVAEEINPVFTCPYCHKEIDNDSIFCNHCGRKIVA